MKALVPILIAIVVAIAAAYVLLNRPSDTSPDTESQAQKVSDLQENLENAEQEKVEAQKELAEANEKIMALEAKAAEAEANAEELAMAQAAQADEPAVDDEEEEKEDEEELRKVSLDEVRAQIEKSPQAGAQIQALTELMYGDFINGIEVDAETKAKLRTLLGESFKESIALTQYAMRDGETTWKEITAWKQEERDYLNTQLKELLPEEANSTWQQYAADIDALELDGQLRNQIRLFSSGLTDENFETVMQIAVEEFRAEQILLEQSDEIFEITENIYYQFRAMDAMRDRLQEFLPQDQMTEVENFFTMAEKLLGAQLPTDTQTQ